MENYKWGTFEGRFKAARRCMQLESEKKIKEANELREKLNEALFLYDNPMYIIMLDYYNVPVYIHFTSMLFENERWKKFGKNMKNYLCCQFSGLQTYVKGNISFDGEPTLDKTLYPHWYVFEDINNELWFMQI